MNVITEIWSDKTTLNGYFLSRHVYTILNEYMNTGIHCMKI